jgi:serine/threonine-protein kinase
MKICEACGATYEGALERCPLDRGRLADVADPLVGQRLLGGAYRVVAPLGAGAIATVYRGRDERLGRDVAIKVLSSAMAQSPRLRVRFLREARAANLIRHPNVIEIHEVGQTDDGIPFLVMELCDGSTLGALLAKPLPLVRAIGIASQMARGLAHAHEVGVVHRDVKPANVIVIDAGEEVRGAARTGACGGGFGGSPPIVEVPRVKLLDLGLANVRGESRLTATGELFGTPAYMAPEQIDGSKAAPPADVYALGCVLFEMITGAPPFLGSSTAVLRQHLGSTAPRVSTRRAGVPPTIDALVASLLDKDPERRPTARAAAASLEELQSGA